MNQCGKFPSDTIKLDRLDAVPTCLNFLLSFLSLLQNWDKDYPASFMWSKAR